MSFTTIIVGDLHLGKKHNVTYGDAKIWDDRSLLILKEIISNYDPTRLILAGDVFDTSKPSSLVYSEFLGIISSVPIVYIIAGNHDISKITEPIAFDNLEALSNVFLVKYQEHEIHEDFNFIGWQPTQEKYDEVMRLVIEEAKEDSVIITHCSRLDFGNKMDNICTDEHIKLAKAKKIEIISGHEHKSSIGNTFSHLGSVVQHTIAETGPRFIWVDGGFKELQHNDDIILTREEPLHIDPDKVYYIKTGKEVTVEDLKLESKDLNIDILEDFKVKAKEAGFDIEKLLK